MKITLAALAFAFAGCGAPQQQYSGSNFWIYVPRPSIDKPRGAPAEVDLPHLSYARNRIEVLVEGEVTSPGAIIPRQGCTVLQAVGYAGGFTDFAFTRRLKLTKLSGQRFNLYLRSRPKDQSGYRQVWHELESPSTADYVLEAGDKLFVPKTVL